VFNLVFNEISKNFINMKKITLSIFLTFSAISVFSQASNFLQNLTKGAFRAKNLLNVVQLNDNRYAEISENGTAIVAKYYNSDKIDTLFNIEKIENCPIKKIENFEFSQNEQKILIATDKKMIYRRSFTAEYYIYDLFRKRIEPLTENGRVQMASFSPNGRIVAFARDNNLFLKKLDFETESQITKDGEKNRIINGTPDWVYEEEFSNIRYFEFSPDSKLLAFVKFDENEVQQFSFQWFNDTYPTLETFKYPKAGTANSKVSLWVYDVDNRTTTQMKIDGEDFYIPTIKWTSTSNALAAVKLSRNQKQIDLLILNPRSSIATRLYFENSQTFSDYQNFDVVQFNSDNSFVLLSEKSGYRHLYLFEQNGIEKQQLTKGNWDVTNFYGYDEKSKTAYFQAAINSPTERNVYSAKNGKNTCLDSRKGFHRAVFANGFQFALCSYENAETPPIFSITNNSGKVLKTIQPPLTPPKGENSPLTFGEGFGEGLKKEFFTFKTSDNVELNAWIMKPQNFNPSKKYPLVMVQYSGPNSQEVLNRWKIDIEYYFADKGFVVACVDGRGTGARGRDFRNITYGKLGLIEAHDQIEAAKYFAKQQYIDSERIAIWGWSYGGLITIMCMTDQKNPFKAGIAIAPVTDWALYNTAYTERFMNKPQENFNGYDQTNLLERAENLSGNLLLIHGTADDNVHTQNTLLFAEKLVDAGKQFDMQLYTNKNHSILGEKARQHLYIKCAEWLKKNM